MASRSALDSKLRADATGVICRSHLAIGWWWSSLGVPVIVELSMPRPIGCGPFLAQCPNSLVPEAKFPWTISATSLLKMAEGRPFRDYSFKPTPEIKTFGERLAIWPAQICSFGGESWDNKRCLALVLQRFPNRN
jgi:hypothetical protein